MEEAAIAAQTLLQRRAIRSDLTAWARECGFEPALHHRLIIKELMGVVKALRDGVKHSSTELGKCRKVIICTPPGSAKSTYTSKLFPPFFLAQDDLKKIRHTEQLSILACSYAKDLITGFGRWNRNIIEQKSKVLGYSLRQDSRAADEWNTTNGGLYFCAGTSAGIAGHRADFALIDDPIGKEEDAASADTMEKLWVWYVTDFLPRLKPGAAQVIIANRRGEEDLVGRILQDEPNEWRVIKIPLIAVENDQLGRAPGEMLWPEYWNYDEQLRKAKKIARVYSGLWQQEPTPDEGNFFKVDDLVTYKNLDALPKNLRIFAGSDHAVSERETADRNCFIPCGVDSTGDLWVLPDVWWKVAGSAESVEAMLAMAKRRSPLFWWAERGHISKSILPFLNARMRETSTYVSIIEVTSTKDKVTRAQSIQGRTAMRKVHFPSFATWWPEALHELLSFPNGKHDDFVDALSEIGQGLDKVSLGEMPAADMPLDRTAPALTLKWMKDSAKRRERDGEYATADR